jgi:hypothetical protein
LILKKKSREKILQTIFNQIIVHINQTETERKICSDILSNLFNLLTDKKLFSMNETLEFLSEFITILPTLIFTINDLYSEKLRMMQKLNLTPENENSCNDEEYRNLQIMRADITTIFLTLFYLIDYNLIHKLHNLNSKTIIELLKLVKILINDSPVPEFWISYNLFQFNVILKFLKEVSNYFLKNFIDNFEKTYWDHVFDLILSFIQSKRLNLKQFSLSKQLKLTVNGDLRIEASELFLKIWV